MNILVDENIPGDTVSALRAIGHTVTDVRGTSAQGADDDTIWAMAQAHRALLITTDKAFAAMWDSPHFGILIVRLRQPNVSRLHDRIMAAIEEIKPEDWPGLTVSMRDVAVTHRRRRPDPERG